MKVLVLGAGVIGTTSAWFLRAAGHEVTVVERQKDAAHETSFANGGQISVSHVEPWANPGAPRQILKWLGRADAPLLFRLRADWRQWRFGIGFETLCDAVLDRSLRNSFTLVLTHIFQFNGFASRVDTPEATSPPTPLPERRGEPCARACDAE